MKLFRSRNLNPDLQNKEDFNDADKIAAALYARPDGGYYDHFVELLDKKHHKLLTAFLMQEMHEATISIDVFRELVDVAKTLKPATSEHKIKDYVFAFRDEVRVRVGLPSKDGRFLTVEEYFTRKP